MIYLVNKTTKNKHYHKDNLTNMILLNDNILMSCSYDYSIKIQDKSKNEVLFHIKLSYSGGFEYISKKNNEQIVSCSFDKSIIIWKVSNCIIENLHTIKEAHSDLILKVIFLSNNSIMFIR